MWPPEELVLEFERAHDDLVRGEPVAQIRRRLPWLACAAIPGCTWAAITCWTSTHAPYTAACTDEVAAQVDRLQYSTGQGPCLSAGTDGSPEWIPDLSVETRWPAFVSTARRATPLHAVMAFRVAGFPQACTINLYGDGARPFDEQSLRVGGLFAAHARIMLSHLGTFEAAGRLRDALATSRHIGEAIGILTTTYHLARPDAFAILRQISVARGCALGDVATEVIRAQDVPRR